MTVEGRLDRILASALPHEVTHTIFASYFGGPMPRWADEGASLLSEDERELQRHDDIAVDLLARRGEIPLSRLFVIEDYPRDLMSFYGQGYSVSRFLVEMGGRPRFLRFIRDGLNEGWDTSIRTHYELANLRELDRAWKSWHRVAGRARTESAPEKLIAARRCARRRVLQPDAARLAGVNRVARALPTSWGFRRPENRGRRPGTDPRGRGRRSGRQNQAVDSYQGQTRSGPRRAGKAREASRCGSAQPAPGHHRSGKSAHRPLHARRALRDLRVQSST